MSKRVRDTTAAPVEPCSPDNWRLGENDVQVWIFPLDASLPVLNHFKEILSSDEKARAARFGTELLQNHFVAGRGTLRTILARYLAGKPEDLKFVYGPAGKPVLAEASANNGLNFNLAHSGSLAAVAVTRGRLIGVDIEKIRPLADAEQLVARFFSANERAVFQGLPPGEKTAAFYNLWTRKEAWLKATGEGIGHLLDQVEVSFIPGKPVQFVRLPQTSPDAAGQWSLHDLSLPPGYAGAVTIPAPDCRLSCRHLNDV